MSAEPPDRLAEAARRAAEREAERRRDPEPSLGARLGRIGALGWIIAGPILLGLGLGRWLDGRFATGALLTAPLIMLGAGAGLCLAWRWMHRG